jgi:hypothetical protein
MALYRMEQIGTYVAFRHRELGTYLSTPGTGELVCKSQKCTRNEQFKPVAHSVSLDQVAFLTSNALYLSAADGKSIFQSQHLRTWEYYVVERQFEEDLGSWWTSTAHEETVGGRRRPTSASQFFSPEAKDGMYACVRVCVYMCRTPNACLCVFMSRSRHPIHNALFVTTCT